MHIPDDKLDGAGLIPEINITIKGSKVSAANVSTVPASCMVKKQTHLDKPDTQRSASAAVLIKVRDTNCILIHNWVVILRFRGVLQLAGLVQSCMNVHGRSLCNSRLGSPAPQLEAWIGSMGATMAEL